MNKNKTNLLDNPIYANEEELILSFPFVETNYDNFVVKRYKSKKFENNCEKINYYLDNIDPKNNFFYCVDAYLILFERSNEQLLEYLIQDIQKYKNISKNLKKKFIFLIDALLEAPSYKFHFAKFFEKLFEKNIILKAEICIISGAYHQHGYVNYAWSLEAAFNGNFPHTKMEKNLPYYHFISLARQIKPHRIFATVEILERNLEKYGNCSLGTGHNINFNKNKELLESFCPEKYKNKFPLYIDGEIIGEKQFDISHPFIKNAFINVVMESSYEKIKNEWAWWQVPFITEKTIKSFVLGQIPIFITCKDTVQIIRDLGFDVFDDIIDHSYDFELDPLLRIKQAIDQLEKICYWTIEDCCTFKQKNMHRFEKNFQNYLYVKDKYKKMMIDNLQKTLDRYDI